jgi:uncharacterized lipoprotein YmbA
MTRGKRDFGHSKHLPASEVAPHNLPKIGVDPRSSKYAGQTPISGQWTLARKGGTPRKANFQTEKWLAAGCPLTR